MKLPNFGRRGQCRALWQLYGVVCVVSRRYSTRDRLARMRRIPFGRAMFWPAEMLLPEVDTQVADRFYPVALQPWKRRQRTLAIAVPEARHPNPLIVVDVPIHYERDTQVVGLTPVELALRALRLFARPFYPRIEAGIFSSLLNMRPAVWSSPGRSH